MEHWFEQRGFDEDLIRVTEPHVNRILRSNVWWIRGLDRDVLVDSGLGVASLRRELPDMFTRHPLVVLTHAHLDHAGGAHEFEERAAHTDEFAALEAGVAASLYGAELAEKLGTDHVGAPFPDLLIDEMPHPSYDPRVYRVEPLSLTRELHDGDRIESGSCTLTVLHLPGHTPGSIALLEERTGVLYSGDVIYDGYLVDDLPESDVTSYTRSMQFLADLDVSTVNPGHGRSFGKTRLHQLARSYRSAPSD